MSDSIQNIITSIATKAKRMKMRNTRLEEENTTLRETVFKHLATISTLKTELEALNTKDNIQQIKTSNKVDAKKVRTMIDNYIKIIDNSIASIKQQD